MIRPIEEGDTKEGIIILKDKFKEFVEFQRTRVKEKKIRKIIILKNLTLQKANKML
jgi:hypothetical protein